MVGRNINTGNENGLFNRRVHVALSLTNRALRMNSPNCCSEVSSSRIRATSPVDEAIGVPLSRHSAGSRPLWGFRDLAKRFAGRRLRPGTAGANARGQDRQLPPAGHSTYSRLMRHAAIHRFSGRRNRTTPYIDCS